MFNQIIFPVSWGILGLFVIIGLNYVNKQNIQETFVVDYMLILIKNDQEAEELRAYLRGKL